MASLVKNLEAMAALENLIKEGMSAINIRSFLNEKFHEKWNIETVRRAIRRFGAHKKKDGSETIEVSDQPILSIPPPGIDLSEKASWFRNKFKQSHLFPKLKRQFETHEVDSYLEEYGHICCQFEDIVLSEFFQIDDYLKHRILIDRQLDLMRSAKKRFDDVVEWIAKNQFDPNKVDLLSDNEKKEQANERMNKFKQLEFLQRELSDANNRYDKLVAERQKIMGNLAATRKDRQDELRGGKENFIALVAKLQASEKERLSQGKYAELTKIASDDLAQNFRKQQKFPDGSMDYIILDSSSDFGDNNE